MSDDVDDRLRHATASLDRQVPARYFDTLADRVLARLDDAAPADFVAEEIVTEDEVIGERDEHSGLQDIRNLASETKARLARRTSQELSARDDRIASSSAGWKAVALPDPTRRVPVGEAAPTDQPIDELARERAAREAARPGSPAAPSAAPRTSLVATRQLASKRRRWVAIAGVIVAAAAGVMIVLSTRVADEARAPIPARAAGAAASPEQVRSIEAPIEALAPAPTSVTNRPSVQGELSQRAPIASKSAPTASSGSAAAVSPTASKPGKPPVKGKRPSKVGKMSNADELPDAPPDGGRDVTAKPPAKPAAGSGQGSDEPSFDALVREAGIPKNAPAKPRLDRQSLSPADVKRGLGAVAAQARACFTGTEGVAAVRLTVAPTGTVTKVTTTGVFAGTPTAACVERAVKSATFPAWDGGPLSVAYSYLLSE